MLNKQGPLSLPVWDESGRCDLGRGLYGSSPQSVMEMVLEVRPDLEPYDSTFFTTSNPAVTLPNTTCLPSSLNAQRAELFLPPDIQNNSSAHPDGFSLVAGLILVVVFFFVFLSNRPQEVHHFYQEFCSQLSADYTPPAAFPHTAA